MIKLFRHKLLNWFYSAGRTDDIQFYHARKRRKQLAALNTAMSVEDMNIPGCRHHLLRGKGKERWSISVNGNWRMTFERVSWPQIQGVIWVTTWPWTRI